MLWFLDCLVIARRDLIRNFRQKSQLLGGIVRPVLWLFLLGAALRNGFTGLPLGINLQQYAFPGIIAMNILFTGVMSGASIIWDREFGFLKEIQVAPVSQLAIVGGKIIGGGVWAVLQGLLVLLLFPFLNITLTIGQFVLAVLAIIFLALAVTSLGVLLAARLKSVEGFGTINNFLLMPMFMLSGAMYPAANIPSWLRYLVFLNPFTYGVDLLRGIVLRLNNDYPLILGEIALFAIMVNIAALYLFRRQNE